MFGHTEEAMQWLKDGDWIQRLETGDFYKKEPDGMYVSHDRGNIWWECKDLTRKSFSPLEEWKSLTNLHYYKDLDPKETLFFLTKEGRAVRADASEADKSKKRWFAGRYLL